MKLFAAAVVTAFALSQTAFAATTDMTETIAPKVVVITMFEPAGDVPGEAHFWIENENLTTRVSVPGLSQAYPDLLCNDDGLCLVTTSMGYANAASSISALVHADKLDLSHTYFLVAGIAGIDPADGTLGSAHWTRYAIDGGLQWIIDARQIPDDWPTGRFGIGTAGPGIKPDFDYDTQVFHLNDALVDKAYALSENVDMADSEQAQAYRAQYAEVAAKAAPAVGVCATVSTDNYWHGSLLNEAMNNWARLLTDGAANYCTSQMEDNATLTALRRGAHMSRVDMDRVAILRTASNFAQEPPGMTPTESLHADSGGYLPSLKNAHRVGSRLAHAIIDNWDAWKNGVPAP